jgi:hypothetical protein
LFLLDAEGQITSRDTSRILPAIRATPDEPAPKSLPPDYNGRVMPVQQLFAQEVRQRNARRDHVLSLTQGQRYALRELRVLFSRTDDEDRKGQIHLLEKAFRLTPTAAVTKELNFLSRFRVPNVPFTVSPSSTPPQRPARRPSGPPVPRIRC